MPTCPVDRVDSPRELFNPHTSTALTAYCKIAVSALLRTASNTAAGNSCTRSTVDTALEIYHSSRVSIDKVAARMIAHSVFLSYCIALRKSVEAETR